MGQGFQRVAAHLLEQLLEAHAALHRVAHHHRVDQRADQAFGVEVTPVRDRCADGDVRAAREQRQPGIQAGQHHHEGRGLVAAREKRHRLAERRRDGTQHARAAQARAGGQAAVGGQRRGVHAGQPRAPVVALARKAGAGGRAALPGGVVGLVDALRRKARRTGFAARLVQLGELAPQHHRRPLIGDQVMGDPAQHMLVVREAQAQQAVQRAVAEVEDMRGLGAQLALQPRRALGGRQRRQIELAPGCRRVGLEALRDLSVAQREAGAEYLVAGMQVVERRAQRRTVERAAQAHHHRHVVGGARGVHLLHQPHALLRVADRHGLAARHGRDRCGVRRRCLAAGRAQGVGQLGHGGVLEQHGQRQLHARACAQPRGDLRRRQRVAAEREEVVVHAEALVPEQLAPDLPHALFDRIARRHRRGLGRADAARQPVFEQRGQRAGGPGVAAGRAAHLAARGAGDAAARHQHHGARADLVGLGHGAADGGGDGGPFAGLVRADFLHQHQRLAFAAAAGQRVVREGHRATGDAGRVRRRGAVFEILRIEIAPAHDQHVLQAAGDVQFAFVPEGEVTGAQPGAVAFGIARGEDSLAVFAAAPVALRHALALQPELADARGLAVAPGLRIDDARAQARQQRAAGHAARAASGVLRAACVQRLAIERAQAWRTRRLGRWCADAQHRLGQAVSGGEDTRAHAQPRQRGDEPVDRLGADRLGAAGQAAQCGEIGVPVGLLGQCLEHGHVGEVRRAAVRAATPCRRLPPRQRRAHEGVRGHQVAAPAGGEGHQHAGHQAVVVEQRQPGQHAAARVHVGACDRGAQLRHHVGVADHHAARRAGGAGGVLQVGELRGADRGIRRILRGRIAQNHIEALRPAALAAHRQARLGQRQHEARGGVVDDRAQHVAAAARRARLRDGHGNAAADHAGPEGAHPLQPGGQHQQHAIAGFAARGDGRGQRAHLLRELRVAQRGRALAVAAHQRIGGIGGGHTAAPVEQGAEVGEGSGKDGHGESVADSAPNCPQRAARAIRSSRGLAGDSVKDSPHRCEVTVAHLMSSNARVTASATSMPSTPADMMPPA